MIRINNVRLELDYDYDSLKKAAAEKLKTEEKFFKSCSLYRRSTDARKKNDVHFTASIDIETNADEEKLCKRCTDASTIKKYEYKQLKFGGGSAPVVVGAGPAGLFAALILARGGANPILIERGRDIDRRTEDVENLWQNGILDEMSNVQFGEGGAGTFSDGKLTTGTKDIRQRTVLEEFVLHGAPKEILFNAKPHIGTDMLKNTVKNIRREIITLGGKVMFETKLTSFNIKDNRLKSICVETEGTAKFIESDNAVLAIGHSARDTFEMLYNVGIPIEAKPFSVGVRIEHLQRKINSAQYGSFAENKRLGAASYKLSTHLDNGRGVYTFCMCPGGTVVNASSETGKLCTNGMSEFSRRGINSNSALLVGVEPKDFGSNHPLAGVEFQRGIEEKAFKAGDESYRAPVQRVSDFLKGIKTNSLGDVIPSIEPGFEFCDINKILPGYISSSLKCAIVKMGKNLRGFDDGDAVLTGSETRSSSPVRIMRNADTLESVLYAGIYPCGEGAGYAGGIVSAAVDGIKCAEKILEKSNA